MQPLRHQTGKMYHLVRGRAVLWLTFSLLLWEACDTQVCSVNDIKAIQSSLDLPTEKLDGLWYVTHVYEYEGATPEDTGYSSYTLDVVSTLRGITLYISKNGTSDTNCDYTGLELNSTSQLLTFSSAGIPNAEPRTVLVAAAASDALHALIYICHGDVQDQQPCTRATALVVGRQPNVTAASSWVNSVSDSLPCFTSDPIVVQQGAVCPLKPFWGLSQRNCDVRTFPVQDNFDLDKYTSRKWYEISWLAPKYLDPSTFYRDYVHQYVVQPNGSIVIFVSGRDPAKDVCFFYQISMTKTGSPGRLIFHEKEAPSPYNVIQTDYDHFAVVFGCVNMTSSGTCTDARGWLWSRGPTLARQYLLMAHSTMQDICLNPAAFFATPQNQECVKDTGGSTSLRATASLTAAMLLFVTSFAVK